mgnify:CR=1 FL=1
MTGNDQEKFQRRTGIGKDDYAVLARIPLFSGLPPDALRSLALFRSEVMPALAPLNEPA